MIHEECDTDMAADDSDDPELGEWSILDANILDTTQTWTYQSEASMWRRLFGWFL